MEDDCAQDLVGVVSALSGTRMSLDVIASPLVQALMDHSLDISLDLKP